ncbi:hypothetical protein [Psychroserpens sp. Hel_I_66]|uniref:hypothetical protein n=1 Tax=Psychroserpens sp. Hel_I_66 TaxID=1250004 RepID=UPI000A6C2613|nr:hypothetical protein [Psychroserpens sp. Hel_I_66]
MEKDESNKKTSGSDIPDSSTKTARGSKKVHSEKDQSTKDGVDPSFTDSEE